MRAWDEDGAAPVAARCLPCALSPSTRLKVGPRTQPPKLARHRLELADHDHVHELPLRVGLCLDKNFAIAKSMKPSENYRPDIDGLRAVSILLVVGYHAHPWMLPGGFVGVDVFFVISGFLITRILLTPGGISLAAFYGRRIKRIFPALIAVLLATYALGYAILSCLHSSGCSERTSSPAFSSPQTCSSSGRPATLRHSPERTRFSTFGRSVSRNSSTSFGRWRSACWRARRTGVNTSSAPSRCRWWRAWLWPGRTWSGASTPPCRGHGNC
ncbi:hypothetical protein ACVWWR_003493 [Bradyrhizobium sp. LM3.2]